MAERNWCLANRRRTLSPSYQPGELVWLFTQNSPLRPESKKLSSRFIGPFTIDKIINPSAISLPVFCALHPLPHHLPGSWTTNLSSSCGASLMCTTGAGASTIWSIGRVMAWRRAPGFPGLIFWTWTFSTVSTVVGQPPCALSLPCFSPSFTLSLLCVCVCLGEHVGLDRHARDWCGTGSGLILHAGRQFSISGDIALIPDCSQIVVLRTQSRLPLVTVAFLAPKIASTHYLHLGSWIFPNHPHLPRLQEHTLVRINSRLTSPLPGSSPSLLLSSASPLSALPPTHHPLTSVPDCLQPSSHSFPGPGLFPRLWDFPFPLLQPNASSALFLLLPLRIMSCHCVVSSLRPEITATLTVLLFPVVQNTHLPVAFLPILLSVMFKSHPRKISSSFTDLLVPLTSPSFLCMLQ